MNKLTLIFLSFLLSLTLWAQEEELDSAEIAEAEDFINFLLTRHYGFISPLVVDRLDWAQWEIEKSIELKLAEIQKFVGEDSLNFRYTDGKSIAISPQSLHFIDYNGDGLEDIIFESYLSQWIGHQVKFVKGFGDHYELDFHLSGKLINLEKTGSKALSFRVHDYPCCDGYVQSIYQFHPTENKETLGYQLVEQLQFIDSNVGGSRSKNLPDSLTLDQKFNLEEDGVLFYQAQGPAFPKYSPSSSPIKRFRNFFPCALFQKGSTGKVLARKKDRDGNRFYFVQFDSSSQPREVMRHFDRNTTPPEIKRSSEISYLGWVEAYKVRILSK